MLKSGSEACTAIKLMVDVYYADVIEQDLRLNQGGLILYALLAGNDFDKGVKGFGTVTALAVAQGGFGDTLITDCQQMGRHGYFRDLKAKVSAKVANNTHKLLRSREPIRAKTLLASGFPSQSALDWFMNPPTSWSDRDLASTLDINIQFPQAHRLSDITEFCLKHIGWSPEETLKRCHQKLWRGVITRILCSVGESLVIYEYYVDKFSFEATTCIFRSFWSPPCSRFRQAAVHRQARLAFPKRNRYYNQES